MIGLYENYLLKNSFYSYEKCSISLVPLLGEILKKHDINALVYANGPGSYMGIKLSYTILKSLSIVKKLPLFALSAFELNEKGAIRANKLLVFIKIKNEIRLIKGQESGFYLPKNLDKNKLSEDNLPFYFLPAL